MINRHVKGRKAMYDVYKAFQVVWPGKWQARGIGNPGSDIIAPEDFYFSIEVKDHAAVQLLHFWLPNKMLEHFWAQTIEQTEPGKKPLLAIKVEGKWFVIFQYSGAVSKVYPCMLTQIATDYVTVCKMDDFLKELGDYKKEKAA